MLFLGEHTAGAVVDGTVTWRVYLMVSMCTFGVVVAALNAGGAGWRGALDRLGRQLRVTPCRRGPTW